MTISFSPKKKPTKIPSSGLASYLWVFRLGRLFPQRPPANPPSPHFVLSPAPSYPGSRRPANTVSRKIPVLFQTVGWRPSVWLGSPRMRRLGPILLACVRFSRGERLVIAKSLLYFDGPVARRAAWSIIYDRQLLDRWQKEADKRGSKNTTRDNLR